MTSLPNKKRTREYMVRYEIEAIIASSAVSVSYFSGLDCWAYRTFRESMGVPGAPNTLVQAYTVIPLDGDPTLIVGTSTAVFAVDLDIDVRIYGPGSSDLSDDLSGTKPSSRYLNFIRDLETKRFK